MIGTFALIIFSVAFITLLSYQKNKASQTSSLQAQVSIRNARLELSPLQKQQKLQRAEMLRQKWKPWASKHRDIVRRMLDAKSEDEAALLAVWNAIPDSPGGDAEVNTIRSVDLHGGTSLNSASLRSGQVFNWNALGKSGSHAFTPEMKEKMSRSQDTQSWRLKHDFKEHKDIVISQSVNTGKTSVCLWASGRVTEKTIVAGRSITVRPDLKMFVVKHNELLPPYEFLKGKS